MFKSISEIKLRQPIKCRGCIWGNWDGLQQYCPKSLCVKESLVEQTKKQIVAQAVSNSL